QRKVLTSILIEIVITVACIYLLIPDPQIGVYGYIAGFLLSVILISLRNFVILNKLGYIRIDYFRILIKPCISFVWMLAIVKLSNAFLISIGFTYNMILSGLLGIISFVVLLLVSGIFTWNQFKNTLNFKK
ncbi:MAG: polysaccharide biosynthesis C-terminal domain-containing protein, partial [Clostridia bacterium]|nr:polysaccharide biosynthesis C-terminal domain-containing protein [Clostridia bacterium]